MRVLAIWESMRLPAVSRRIRWKLAGFELGVHFPSLQKLWEKYLGLRRVILCAIFCPFSALANWCSRAPGTAIAHAPGAPFRLEGKLNESQKIPRSRVA